MQFFNMHELVCSQHFPRCTDANSLGEDFPGLGCTLMEKIVEEKTLMNSAKCMSPSSLSFAFLTEVKL